MTTRITSVFSWEALDSRGTPTVACEVGLAGGSAAQAIVPSGASTGAHEARERRDGGDRYGGRGVRHAVANVNDVLGPFLVGRDVDDPAQLDDEIRALDGSPNLERLGANAVLAVSVATWRAAAAAAALPLHRYLCPDDAPLLPMPMINIVSGGAHAARAIDFQDFLVIPVGATSFAEAIEWTWRVRREAAVLVERLGSPSVMVADEGGLAARFERNEEPMALVTEAIVTAGFAPGADVAIAIDVASTQLWRGGGYELASEGRTIDADEMTALLEGWVDRYPLVSIEDPLAEDDWPGWQTCSSRLRDRVQVIGDDLFCTNATRLERGIAEGTANAVLVKPNQIGTLTDAQRVVEQARAAGYATVVSARSGETEDDWLADLAVGWRAGQVKVGSLTRSERQAKWNRLLRIEAEVPGATFAGRAALAPRP
jgi:enolase